MRDASGDQKCGFWAVIWNWDGIKYPLRMDHHHHDNWDRQKEYAEPIDHSQLQSREVN